MSSVSEQRRRIMRAIKAENTSPEMRVRRLLHSMGYRYRLHVKDLPGKPDIVFPKRCKVIFINGCFWHSHDCKRGRRIPKSNREYWIDKISSNRERDLRNFELLRAMGWEVLVVWECELKDEERLRRMLIEFIES